MAKLNKTQTKIIKALETEKTLYLSGLRDKQQAKKLVDAGILVVVRCINIYSDVETSITDIEAEHTRLTVALPEVEEIKKVSVQITIINNTDVNSYSLEFYDTGNTLDRCNAFLNQTNKVFGRVIVEFNNEKYSRSAGKQWEKESVVWESKDGMCGMCGDEACTCNELYAFCPSCNVFIEDVAFNEACPKCNTYTVNLSEDDEKEIDTIPWKLEHNEHAHYIGIIEFFANEEYHNFEVYQTETHLCFGSHCNTGFLESGNMIIDDCFSIDENLSELINDLEVYYLDGKEYTNFINCNKRM